MTVRRTEWWQQYKKLNDREKTEQSGLRTGFNRNVS